LLATTTIVMSVPLLLSYNIKYFVFPEGYAYVILYTWGLLSVFLVPILLLAEVVSTFRIVASRNIAQRRPSIFWDILAMGVALIAEVTFLIVRNSPP
jgi:hypothetical protein